MSWTVDMDSSTPPSRQLVDGVLDAIARGELRTGNKLPSVRKLAAEVLVNPNTVAKAYRDLEQMGAVRGQNGRGVFVTEAGETIAREARLDTTLEAFQQSAHEALRAGHTLEDLLRIINRESDRRSA